MIGVGVGLSSVALQLHPIITGGHDPSLLEEDGSLLLLEDGSSHILL